MSTLDDRSNRTEKPTPKRKRQFRRRGDIAQSKDLIQIATLFGGGLMGMLLFSRSWNAISKFTSHTLANLDEPSGSLHTAVSWTFLWGVAPTTLGAAAGALLLGFSQLGWPPAFKWPKPSLNFLQFQKIMGMLSPKAIVGRTLVQILKFGAVAIVVTLVVVSEYHQYLDHPATTPVTLLARFGSSIWRIAIWSIMALTALALFDYGKARFKFGGRIRMTKEEVKREHKENEGDPKIKARRRGKMRELVRRNFAKAVPKADVVLVNPTHYAVALRYMAGKDRAPRVVAKGVDSMAEFIRALARRAGVPVVSEPPLTRLIYKLVPIGREIPSKLYHAVAEVLAYVYRLRGRAK